MNEDTPSYDDRENDPSGTVCVSITYHWHISARLLQDLQAGVEGAQEYFDQDVMTDVVHSTDPDVQETTPCG